MMLQGLEDGTHTIAVKVTDEAGRETTSWRTFKVDATAPSVVDISPTGGDQPTNVRVEVKFSEKMDRDSVDIDVAGTYGTIKWEGSTLVFTPENGFQYSTEYEVMVTGTDEYGNEMETYSHSFSTFTVVVEDVVDDEPEKNGMNILPIIIGAVAVSLISGIGVTFLVMRKKHAYFPEE